jgi:hypothetical protein
MWDSPDGGPMPAMNPGRHTVTLYDTKELAEIKSERQKEYSSTGRFKVYPWPFAVKDPA